MDKEGKPTGNWETPAKSNAAPANAADTTPAGAGHWQGNQWVDESGAQKGDWGHAPDWRGNEWVDEQGKPKADWTKDPGKK